MRQILFRGKDLSGVLDHSWIFGSLDTTEKEYPSIIYLDRFGNRCRISVNHKTVGQYTGLTDKNGKKIFEGDIVRLYGDENNPDTKMIDYNALVIFKKGRFCAIDGTEDNHSFERLIFNSYLNCEVIGNKYDNPELLEAQE